MSGSPAAAHMRGVTTYIHKPSHYSHGRDSRPTPVKRSKRNELGLSRELGLYCSRAAHVRWARRVGIVNITWLCANAVLARDTLAGAPIKVIVVGGRHRSAPPFREIAYDREVALSSSDLDIWQQL